MMQTTHAPPLQQQQQMQRLALGRRRSQQLSMTATTTTTSSTPYHTWHRAFDPRFILKRPTPTTLDKDLKDVVKAVERSSSSTHIEVAVRRMCSQLERILNLRDIGEACRCTDRGRGIAMLLEHRNRIITTLIPQYEKLPDDMARMARILPSVQDPSFPISVALLRHFVNRTVKTNGDVTIEDLEAYATHDDLKRLMRAIMPHVSSSPTNAKTTTTDTTKLQEDLGQILRRIPELGLLVARYLPLDSFSRFMRANRATRDSLVSVWSSPVSLSHILRSYSWSEGAMVQHVDLISSPAVPLDLLARNDGALMLLLARIGGVRHRSMRLARREFEYRLRGDLRSVAMLRPSSELDSVVVSLGRGIVERGLRGVDSVEEQGNLIDVVAWALMISITADDLRTATSLERGLRTLAGQEYHELIVAAMQLAATANADACLDHILNEIPMEVPTVSFEPIELGAAIVAWADHATSSTSTNVLRRLLDTGCAVGYEDALMDLAIAGNMDACMLLTSPRGGLDASSEESAAFRAAVKAKHDALAIALMHENHAVDPMAKNGEALTAAIKDGRRELMTAILASPRTTPTALIGCGALRSALLTGDVSTTTLLLDQTRSKLNAHDHWKSIWDFYGRETRLTDPRHVGSVRAVLEHGAIRADLSRGEESMIAATILRHAIVDFGDVDAVRMLCEEGWVRVDVEDVRLYSRYVDPGVRDEIMKIVEGPLTRKL